MTDLNKLKYSNRPVDDYPQGVSRPSNESDNTQMGYSISAKEVNSLTGKERQMQDEEFLPSARKKNITARKKGGPVKKKKKYLVGEEGPEIFQPDQNGNIIPNKSTRRGLGFTVKTRKPKNVRLIG
jgi:hypothetical protein